MGRYDRTKMGRGNLRASSEPGLSSRPDILFCEEFEWNDWWTHWTWLGPDIEENTRLVPGEGVSGGQCLEVTFRKDRNYGTSLYYFLPGPLYDGRDERKLIAYLRYYVRFAPDFDFGEGGIKIAGLRGTIDRYSPAARGGGPTNSGTGFSARPNVRKNGELRLQLYHHAQKTRFGDLLLSDPMVHVVPGQWHSIEIAFHMNSLPQPGNPTPDGRFQMRFDGRQVLSLQGLVFRCTPALKIDQIVLDTYFGNPKIHSPKDQCIQYDQIVLSEKPIGPIPR